MPPMNPAQPSERFSWKGFPMAGVPIQAFDGTTKGIRVHLEDKEGGTLCGLLRLEVTERNVATGWPDCDQCIKTATEPPKPSFIA